MRALYTLLPLLMAASTFAQQQPDWNAIEIKVQKVAGNIHMVTGRGGNIGVSAGQDGLVIVDDQYAPLAPRLREALRGISDRPIRFILNTHYHGDHTGGNELFGREAPIVAHENVRKRLQSGTKTWGRDVPPAPKGALPIVTFNDRVTIHINGEDVRAIHFPAAHTDGDAVIFFTRSNVVHMGDNFFNGNFPVIDLDNGGSPQGMIAQIEKVLAMLADDVKIIPGHGPLSDKAGLRAFQTMLKETLAAVTAAKKAGKTLDQMKSEKVLGRWEALGKGFVTMDLFTEVLYRSLERK